MGDYYRLLLRAELDPAAHPGEAKRELARRLVERFHDAEAAAAAEERFDQLHVRGEVPEDVEEAVVEASGPERVGPPAGAARRAVRPQPQRGAAADRSGRRAGRRPGAGAGTLDLPAAELDGQVLQVGKRRHRRLRVA